MTHLPYIAAAYVIAIGLPVIFCIEVYFRTRSAERRLAAIDPRRRFDPSPQPAASDPPRERGRP